MRIRTVEFAGAVTRPGQPPPIRLPQIAFAGRSNVGKSSVINRLLGRTRTPVARVSGTPGKTREINFYRVNAVLSRGSGADFLLADLPGYGYARAPDAVRRKWRPLIEAYLESGNGVVGVVQLIDARHDPTAEDRRMLDYLGALGLPVLVVLTKTDKLSASRRAERVARLEAELPLDPVQIVVFSARTGEGREGLLHGLDDLLTETR